MSVRSEIIDGMAENLWATGWFQHVEEHGCERLSGRNIIDIMPPIPKDARAIADTWATEVEKKNGKSLDKLYAEAMAANKREGIRASNNSTENAFGHDLVYMITGAGADWFDDNAKFPLKTPSHESPWDLQALAGERCKKAWDNPPCKECGAFSRDHEKTCSNCGEARDDDDEDD